MGKVRQLASANAMNGQIVAISNEGIADMGKSVYSPVGYCIYCFSNDDLRREHIVPFGLNGNAVLPAATCPRCAAITGNFERKVLRGLLARA